MPQDTLTSFLSQHKEPATRPAQPSVPPQPTQPEQPRQPLARPVLKEAACQTIELDLPLMSALDSPLAAHRYSHSTTPRPSAIPRRSSRANSMTSSMSRPNGWGADGPGKPEKQPSGSGDSHDARVLNRRLEHSVKETDQLRRQVLIRTLMTLPSITQYLVSERGCTHLTPQLQEAQARIAALQAELTEQRELREFAEAELAAVLDAVRVV